MKFGIIAFNCLLLVSCRKETAPYIDNAVGTYKVTGSITLDSAHSRYFTDTILTVSKVNSATITFLVGGCDLTLLVENYTFINQDNGQFNYG